MPFTFHTNSISYSVKRSRNRIRTYNLFLNRESLCQLSYAGMAFGLGFEPRLMGPEPIVLPFALPESTRPKNRTRINGFGSHCAAIAPGGPIKLCWLPAKVLAGIASEFQYTTLASLPVLDNAEPIGEVQDFISC